MPKGGLGNLIALPLNGASRAKGNSVFVDDEFNAYAGDEQWRILSEVARIRARRSRLSQANPPNASLIWN